MGIQLKEVECFSVSRPVTDNGIFAGLPDESRCFTEKAYVIFDRQSGRSWIKIYQDWMYGQKKDKRSTFISGRNLLKGLAEIAPETESQSVTVRKLRAAERRANMVEVTAMAEALLVIRQEGFEGVEDISEAIRSAQKELLDISQNIDGLQQKNEECNIAAKYLLAYRETIFVQTAYEGCNKFRRETYRRTHGEELRKHAYAIEQLEKWVSA